MFVYLFSESNDRSGGELSTVGVAAAIAGPMCVICALIMLFICWHQKRQQEQFHEAEAALQPMEDEVLIPPGQTLKELMDMSTGIKLYMQSTIIFIASGYSVLLSFIKINITSTYNNFIHQIIYALLGSQKAH